MEYYNSTEAQSSNYSLGPGPPPALGNQISESAVASSTQVVQWTQESNEAMNVDRGTMSQLEQALFRISLQSTQEGSEEVAANYPERPGEPDCVYFMRTGQCAYGMACKFNHPSNRLQMNAGALRGKFDYPERPGQPECQYYLKTGMCKFGVTCKYDHPRDKAGLTSQAPLNFSGLPIRVGEKECAFYMRTGLCKYGQTCKYNHPPLPPGTLSPPVANSPNLSVQSVPTLPWPVHRPPFIPAPRLPLPGSFPAMMLPTQPGMMTMPAWTYQAQSSENAQQNNGGNSYMPNMQVDQSIPSSPYNQPAFSGSGLNTQSQYPSPNKETQFPQRIGQPECQYYMKTGDCKFGITCRFHHPKERSSPTQLNTMGLPLRPGAQPCPFYIKHGLCKFASTCKFDHPDRGQDQSSQHTMQHGSYLIPLQYYSGTENENQSAVQITEIESHQDTVAYQSNVDNNPPHSNPPAAT